MGNSIEQLSGVATVDESSGGWSDDNSSSLWGWLGSIVDGLKAVWETIKNLPQNIADKLKSFFDNLLSGIKSIFVPDTDKMEADFQNFANSVSVNALGTDDLDGLFDVQESEPSDISSDITIGNDISVGKLSFSNIKFLDLKYFKQGIVYFRPIINGFLTWLLGMFYYNQLLSFLGQGGLIAKEFPHDNQKSSKRSS